MGRSAGIPSSAAGDLRADQSWVRAIAGQTPDVAAAAFIAPGALILGRVRVGRGSSIWYGCVLRGDDDDIVIGEDCNIQDGTIMHADPGEPTVLGDRVSVGHGAIVHGARLADDVLVGMRAVVLNRVTVGRGTLIAAGAVVRPGTEIPPDSFVAGVPAKVRPLPDDRMGEMIRHTTEEYRRLSALHAGVWE